MIRSIVERTGCKIDVEDDGRVSIASVDEAAARKAVAIIEELTATPELNKTYLGKIVRIVEFGAFVEILPGTDGLLHVSEMATHHVKDVRSEVKEGDQVLVKVVNIDPSGKIRLSRKALIAEAQGGDVGAGDGGQGGEPRPQGAQRPHAEQRHHDERRHGEHRGGRRDPGPGRDRRGDRR
jgi:polyribonucleotide nucleotidyltransferase